MIYLLIAVCNGAFTVLSPDNLTTKVFDYTIANFGDPGLYSQYSELKRIDFVDSCDISDLGRIDNSYAVLYGFNSCYFSDLALQIQGSGGLGMIYINRDDDLWFTLEAKDLVSMNKVKILLIAMSYSDGEILAPYFACTIWGTYIYPMDRKASAKLNFQMTGNYSKDKDFITQISNLVNKFKFDLQDFDMKFSNQAIVSGIDPYVDCIFNDLGNFCLPSSQFATGAQKVQNAAVVLNFFNSSASSKSEIFNFLLQLYSDCQSDYSLDCLSAVLLSFNASPNLSFELLVDSNTYPENIPFLNINARPIWWNEYIEKSYCLSLIDPPSECIFCNAMCPFPDLYKEECVIGCNVTDCGYDSLKCLQADECYTFMMTNEGCNNTCNITTTENSSTNSFVPILIGSIGAGM